MKSTKSTRGEKTVAASVFLSLLFATGLDADNETSCMVALVGAIVCLIITGFGMWLMWLDAGRAESGSRVEEMRRISRLTMKIDKTHEPVKRMTVDQYVAERKKLKKARGFSTVLQQEMKKLMNGKSQ